MTSNSPCADMGSPRATLPCGPLREVTAGQADRLSLMDHGAIHRVLELADVAGPVELREDALRLRR